MHRVIQAAFGLPEDGAFDFRGAGAAWSNVRDIPGLSTDVLDASGVTLQAAARRMTSVGILHHSPNASAQDHNTVRVASPKSVEPGARYPRLIEAEGRLSGDAREFSEDEIACIAASIAAAAQAPNLAA